jgi:hypothetical protein
VRKGSLSDNAERVAGSTRTAGLVISLESGQRLFRTEQTPKGQSTGDSLRENVRILRVTGSSHDPEGSIYVWPILKPEGQTSNTFAVGELRMVAAPKFLSKQALNKPDLINKKQTKGHAKGAGRSADVAVKTLEAVCRISNRYGDDCGNQHHSGNRSHRKDQ